MPDPLTVTAAVLGLVAKSAQLGLLSKKLYDSAKDAPESMVHIQQEIDDLHSIFVEMGSFIQGTAKKGASKRSLSMIKLNHLMTILSSCALVVSKLEKKLNEVAGLVDPTTQKPARGLQCTVGRIKWAFWKEAEVGVLLEDLQRHKSTLQLMLSMIQCNTAPEANERLEKLEGGMEKLAGLMEKLLESHVETSIQLRAFISRQPNESPAHGSAASEHNIEANIISTSGAPSLDSANRSTLCLSNDRASIRTATTSFSSQSVQSFTRELFRSRAYKRLNHRRAGANSAGSIYSKDSSATKGDRWSMLSDISLGDLAISEISVLELPICGSDLYDSQPYDLAGEATSTEKLGGTLAQCRAVLLPWPSRGKIHTAIRTNDNFVLRTLITLGADLEEKDSEGYTPLIVAIRKCNSKVCRTLLDIGVEVGTCDSAGITPLIHAITFRNDDSSDVLYANGGLQLGLCKLLVDAGAVVDTPDPSGRTPLSYAVCNQAWDDFSLCKFLIDKGAAVDAPDSSGRTPLSYAMCAQSWDTHGNLCKLLLDKGAAVNTPDSSGRTPLSYAMCARIIDNHEACKLLIGKGADIDTPDATGCTPLSYAADSNQWHGFRLLVDKSAAVDTPDSSGRTPLSYAATSPFGRASVKIVKCLVDQDAVVDIPDSSGRTPLSYAAAGGGLGLSALHISKLLVNAGAAVDTLDLSGRTPLSYAAGSAATSWPGVRYWADLGRQWVKGRAIAVPPDLPLDTRMPVCKLLLDKNARIDTCDSSGHSPYWYARDANNNDICRFLSQRGAKQDP